MTLLEDIWYGNIRPVERFVDGNTEYKGLLQLVSKNRETLENELSQKQLEFFEKYNASASEMASVSETAAFQYGFSLGVQIMTECVFRSSNNT